jgi:cell division protein FtsL
LALTTNLPPQVVSGVAAVQSLRAGLVGAALVALLVLGSALVLVETSVVASAGYENARLQQEKRAVEHRLQELQSEVASLTSLEHVDVEARNSLGMVDATSHLYVQVDQSLKGR